MKIKKENEVPVIAGTIVAVALVIAASIYSVRLKSREESSLIALSQKSPSLTPFPKEVELPVRWGDLGIKMVKAGVVDKEKFENLYNERGGLSPSDKKLLDSENNDNLVISQNNSGVILNILWAFGLGNKNVALSEGPMSDERYGGAKNFASTGGWTLSEGNAMAHYNMHSFVTLTKEQQELVERVSKGIFRPCCNNSTYFPDCNHGMAMLGLLELMASQGATETEMYKVALEVNTFWFPSQYEAIKVLFAAQGVDWNNVDPKKALSAEYSSSSGYQRVLSQIGPQEQKGGSSCGA